MFSLLLRLLAALAAAAFGVGIGEPFWDAMTRDPQQALLSTSGATVSDRRGLPYLALDPSAASVSVEFADLPADMVNALLAAEDKRFFDWIHWGVDPIAIGRATVAGVASGFRFGQGGSTLTCQLVKNTYGRRGTNKLANVQRKIFENLLAIRVEIAALFRLGSRREAKESIMAAYCNRVSFGGASTGLREAVRYYYPGKGLADLTLGECAQLAGMVRGPGLNNPHVSGENARIARDRVLGRMRELGFAPEKEAGQFLVASRPGSSKMRGDGFTIDMIRQEVATLVDRKLLPLDISTLDGAEVILTLDLKFQDQCSRLLREELKRIESLPGYRHPTGQLQGAVVVLDHSTGGALAVVGGRDHEDLQFNLALGGRRFLASAIKPLVYAAYLDRFPGDASRSLSNAPLEKREAAGLFGIHSPRETSRLSRGTHSIVEGIAHSSNRMSIRAGSRVGWETWHRIATSIQLAGEDYPRSTDVWLGAYPASPWRAASAFSALARRGDLPAPHLIAAVVRREGDETLPLYAQRTRSRKLFSPSSCDLVHEGLSAVLTRGTAASPEGRKLSAETGAAGKTGTSGAVADAWFIGYTDSVVVGVWIGFPDGSLPIFSSGTGANLAFPLFDRIVRSAPSDMGSRVDWRR